LLFFMAAVGSKRIRRTTMRTSHNLLMLAFSGLALAFSFVLASPTAADLNPSALAYTLPKDIPWVDQGNGSVRAVLAGNPDKSGMYVLLYRWKAHNMSRPHFHPNDRFITVISGTWWVGTGSKYDPDGMKPVPAGSFVTHFG